MSISEREKEIGVMRAAGARSSDVVKLFLYEVLMISGSGGVAGVIIGLAFVIIFQNLMRAALEVPFLLPRYDVTIAISIIALLLSVLTSAIATFRPIRKISAKPPYYSMREGG
jgi:putative ABC transport system permease protein